MTKRIAYLVYCILIAAFVTAVIYYMYNKDPVLQYINRAFSDSNNTNATWCVTGRPCTYPDVVDLRIVVITFNRAYSLSKLLRSVDTLVLDGVRAALEIWIDRDRKNGVHQRTLEVASAFSWNGGPTRVHVQVALYCLVFYLDL